MSSSVDVIEFPSGCRVVGVGALAADNAQDAGGGSGAMSRGTAASAGGMWMGTSVLPAGKVSSDHHHDDQTTIVCVISGVMHIVVAGPAGQEEFSAGPGEIAVIPAGLVHREENTGAEECVCVVVRNAEAPTVVNV